MTEAEWLTCEAPSAMLNALHAVNERKLRLFGVACCRDWDAFEDAGLRRALDFAETLADGKAGERERTEMEGVIWEVIDWNTIYPHGGSGHDPILSLVKPRYGIADAGCAAERVTEHAEFYDSNSFDGIGAEIQYEQSNLLREIFGNPFRRVAFDPAWRTSDVMLLAQGIYAEKAFDRLPILADALQDAGCDSDELLAHLRDTSLAHVRGCWALDLVLGKA